MSNLSINTYSGGTKPVQARTYCYVVVEPRIVDVLRSWRARDNSSPLMAQFGISYNTWRKIQAGEPVRRSIAERLEAHVRRQKARLAD